MVQLRAAPLSAQVQLLERHLVKFAGGWHWVLPRHGRHVSVPRMGVNTMFAIEAQLSKERYIWSILVIVSGAD
jgi:hypothetical protein